MKPSWSKKLSEVLLTKTEIIERKSPRTGSTYNVEVVPSLNVKSTGAIERRVDEEGNVKYRYSVVDIKNNLEFQITAPNKLDVSFGMNLQFKQVSGGPIGNTGNGWYAATAVSQVK